MKASILLCLIAASALLAEAYFPETPLSAGLRRRPKIVGGREALRHSIPYQLGLLVGQSFCGGSLITKRYALTAAHCGILTKSPVVIMGAHAIREKEPEQVQMTGKRVIVHKDYSPVTLDNDIALIELPQDVSFNNHIKAIKLTDSNGGLFVGATGQVSGWGLAYDGATGISPVLRVVESEIMSNAECQKKFGFRVDKSIICLDGSKKKGSCNGDSGGPLVVMSENEEVQVGVVSFGSSAGCEKGFPSGFTRITSYINWIKEHSDYE